MFLRCLVCSSMYTSDPWFSHGLCNMWVQLTERSESSPNLQSLLVPRCRYCAGPVRPLAESIRSSSDHCARGCDTDAALSSPVALPRPTSRCKRLERRWPWFSADRWCLTTWNPQPVSPSGPLDSDDEVDEVSLAGKKDGHSKSICRSIIKQLPILIF